MVATQDTRQPDFVSGAKRDLVKHFLETRDGLSYNGRSETTSESMAGGCL